MIKNKQYIDTLFSPDYKDNEVVEAFKEIVEIQKSTRRTVKTGIEHMDYFLFDGLTNKMVFIGSRPSMGKTHNCARVIKNLIDEELNPPNISILRLNWEMQTKSLLLRNIKQHLKKSMRAILSAPFTDDDQNLVTEAVNEIRNKKIRNVSEILEGDEFEYLLDSFGKSGDPDEEKIVLVDHLHILGTKERIDAFLSICNKYKLRYKKLSFIFYFQLNRTLETLWRGKDSNPRNYRPSSLHIYNTDALMQYADIICTMVIPQVVNLDTYAVVNRKYCENIQEHFIDEGGDSNWVKLEGRNRVYFDYIKIRMVDDFEDPRLYCEILNNKREETLREEDGEELEESMPAFMKTPKEQPPMKEGGVVQAEMFGERGTKEDDDLPF